MGWFKKIVRLITINFIKTKSSSADDALAIFNKVRSNLEVLESNHNKVETYIEEKRAKLKEEATIARAEAERAKIYATKIKELFE